MSIWRNNWVPEGMKSRKPQLSRRRRLDGLVLVGGGILGTAWADEAPGMMHAVTGAGQTGAEIYVHLRQGCHMPQGQGAAGAGHYPSLARSGDLAGRLGQLVAATVVLNGRNGMPAFGHSQRSNPSNE